MLPGEREALVPAKLRRDDDFQVRECAVFDVDFVAIAILDRSHPRTIAVGGMALLIEVRNARGLADCCHRHDSYWYQ